MKKLIAGVILLAIAIPGGWYGYRRWSTSGTAETTQRLETRPVARGPLESLVIGTGTIEARTMIEVKSRASGQVVKFEADEGDDVRRGQLLVQLDGTEEERSLQVSQASLAGAEADVTKAEAALAALHIEHALDIKAEQAKVDSAKVQVERARITLALFRREHPSTIATIEAQLEAARQDLTAAANVLERQQKLHQSGETSIADLEAARAAHQLKNAAVLKLAQDLSLAQGSLELQLANRQQDIEQLLAALAGVSASREKLEASFGQTVAMRQSELASAKARADSARVERDRAKERVDQTRVYSELDGVLVSKLVEEGQIIASGISSVSGGTALAQVADLDTLYVVADVDESDVGKVRVGQRARITVDAYPTTVFRGRVSSIAPQGVAVSNVVVFKVKILVYSLRRRVLSEFLNRDGQPGEGRRRDGDGGRGAGSGSGSGSPGAGSPRSGSRGGRGGGEGDTDWVVQLGLDAEQRTKARAAFASYAEQFRGLGRDVPDETRADRDKRREAITAARKQLEAALREILTPAQYAQYNERLLRIGMSASVEIEVGLVEDGLLVPAESLRRVKGQRGVYVLESGKPVFRPVGRVLLETGEQAALSLDDAAIKEGEEVVLKGMSPTTGANGQRSRSFLPGMGGGGRPGGRR